jgi:hypothetical protein
LIAHIVTFLENGGVKLLFIAAVFAIQFARARAKIAKKREREVRGNTVLESPVPLGAQQPIAASPWSNMDAFDGKKL